MSISSNGQLTGHGRMALQLLFPYIAIQGGTSDKGTMTICSKGITFPPSMDGKRIIFPLRTYAFPLFEKSYQAFTEHVGLQQSPMVRDLKARKAYVVGKFLNPLIKKGKIKADQIPPKFEYFLVWCTFFESIEKVKGVFKTKYAPLSPTLYDPKFAPQKGPSAEETVYELASQYDQTMRDLALCDFWEKDVNFNNKPTLTTAKEIRAWLAKPENKEILLKTKSIRFDSGHNIKVVPEELRFFTNIQRIDFWRNHINQVPGFVGDFKDLQDVRICCKLQQVPPFIQKMNRLSSLDLSHNLISEIPASLGKLKKLDSLDLGDNLFTRAPKNLRYLKNLWSLTLSKCPLQGIPDNFQWPKKIRILRLSEAGISELPPSLQQLSSLIHLDLSQNKLKKLPDWIAKLPIDHLRLSENEFEEIPDAPLLPNVKDLNLSRNQIKSLPARSTRFQKLEKLDLSCNGIKSTANIDRWCYEELKLSGNQIREVGAGCTGEIDFGSNNITELSDSVRSAWKLRIEHNPIVWISKKLIDPDERNPLLTESVVETYKAEMEYTPTSRLGMLYSAIQKRESIDVKKKAFDNLSKSERELVFEMAYEQAQLLERTEWQEHICEDEELLARSVYKAIDIKRARLNPDEKMKIKKIVWSTSRQVIVDAHGTCTNNRLKMADMMESLENQDNNGPLGKQEVGQVDLTITGFYQEN